MFVILKYSCRALYFEKKFDRLEKWYLKLLFPLFCQENWANFTANSPEIFASKYKNKIKIWIVWLKCFPRNLSFRSVSFDKYVCIFVFYLRSKLNFQRFLHYSTIVYSRALVKRWMLPSNGIDTLEGEFLYDSSSLIQVVKRRQWAWWLLRESDGWRANGKRLMVDAFQ